jgi:hypothetical protein
MEKADQVHWECAFQDQATQMALEAQQVDLSQLRATLSALA